MTANLGRDEPAAALAEWLTLSLLKRYWTLPTFRVIRAVLLNLGRVARACWLRTTPEDHTLIETYSFNRDWTR